ncbi:MAG: acyl-CoA dehydrogenase, partial [Pseudomonadota bacterium]
MLNFNLSEEQTALSEAARRFSKERIIPAAAAADRDAKFPRDVFEEAWRLGLINTTVPTDYGGAGLGELDNALITEQLAYGCTGIQTSMLANTLAATPVLLAGSEEQKRKYLGMLTAEPRFASYCTTEPSGGSDVAAMKTQYKKVGSDYVLSGEKCWITNASLASFYVVFATGDPSKKHKGIAAFIVDRDAPGVRPGKKEDKLGQRASDTAVLHLDEVVVPKANLLGGEGQGFKL